MVLFCAVKNPNYATTLFLWVNNKQGFRKVDAGFRMKILLNRQMGVKGWTS